MPQVVNCGGCGARYQVDDRLAGTLVDCPKCQTRILVPRKVVAPGTGAPATARQAAAVPNAPAAKPANPQATRTPAASRPPAAPAASMPPAMQKPARPAPAAPPAAAARKPVDDDVIRFRDADDEPPAVARPIAKERDEDEFELAPEPEPPRRPPADRGSIAGISRAGQTGAGQTGAGQTRSGQSLAGQAAAGQTRAGQSVAGQSRAGQTRAGQTRAGQTGAGTVAGVSASLSGSRAIREIPPEDGEGEPPVMDEVFDLKEPEPAREPESEFQFSIPKLPSLVTEVVMPWVLTVACLGSAGYVAVEHILALPGRPVGFGMLAAALLLYAVLLVPLTVKALHSAAITAKLRLPNVIWFQTFSLLALPTAGLVIGLDAGGTGSMITLGILGLAAMFVLMALMLRADVMQSVAAAFYAGSAYVGWGALCVAILGGAGLILNHAGQTVPWLNPPVEVAQTTKAPDVAPPPSTAPVVAPVVAAPVPVVAPVVAAAPAPAPVVPAGPAWRVPVEPMAAAAMWPATENEVRASIEVANPVATAHSVGGPFVALLQPQFTAVYDLRTGRRSGFIKTAFQPNNLIVSSDGTMLAGLETGASEGMFAGADGSPVGGVEIWSTIDGHILGRVPTGAPGPIPQPLGFASGKLIATGSSNGVSGLQAWDITSGTIQHQWNTPPVSRSTMVISNSGQFVAVAASPVIRVFDVNSGEIAGELSAPFAVPRPTGMSFSPDGKTFAAIVRGTVEGSAGPNAGGLGATGSQSPGTLLEWNVADGGKLLRAVPIDLTATMPPFNATAGDNSAADAGDVAYLQWTPDGRMVRIGGGLFEITSGKTIFTLPPQMSGNLVGRFISVGNQRSTYEFLPTGIGSRLLIKTFDLPTATIDSAVAFAIASTSKPLGSGAELASAIGMPTTSPAVAASPTKASVRLSSGMNSGGSPTLSTSGPAYSALIVPSPTLSTAPPAHATVQLALQGNWDVQIKSIDRPDSMAIQQNLVTQTAELAQIQTNLERVIAKSDQVSRYQEFTQPDGEITRQYQYPDDVRTAADKALAKAQQQLRDAKVTVAKLQTAAAAAPTSRTVSSVLDNGVATTIQTDSTASAALVDLMHAGDRVHITGKGRVSQGILVVTLQTAMPLPQK